MALGASLLAVPVGPTIGSFDDIRELTAGATTNTGGSSTDSADPLLASAANDGTPSDQASDRASDRIAGSGPALEIGLAALDQISYPWASMLPAWTIEFTEPNDELFGLTHTRDERIEIFVRPDQTVEQLAHVIAHELGHAVDVTLNDGDDRRAWQDARSVGAAEWWPGSGTTDFATGAGDFAESFAAWQVGEAGFRSEIGDVPTDAQIELMQDLAADR